MKNILTISAIAAFTFTASAQFLVGPELRQATSVPGTVAASTIVATNSSTLTLSRNQGVSFNTSLTATNVDPSLVTFYLAVSYDGTNFTTTNNAHRVIVPVVINPASAPVIYSTNFSADVLNNVKQVRIMGINNAVTNTLTINHVTWGSFR